MIDKETLPLVAYEMMNEVHFEEVDILNRLEDLLEEDEPDHDRIDTTLAELLEHTKGHFSNEEKLMEEVYFPAFMMHQGEHQRILNEMMRIINQWQANKNNDLLKAYFLGVLQEWLMTHITTMDTVTAQFICMRKGCQ